MVKGETDDFFNMESTFSKMKSTAVFMNIGRGTTVNEEDLIKALKEERIGGAVLDVFAKEPIDDDNELWNLPNVLLSYHQADVDVDFQVRAFETFIANLEKYSEDGKDALMNKVDKELGY